MGKIVVQKTEKIRIDNRLRGGYNMSNLRGTSRKKHWKGVAETMKFGMQRFYNTPAATAWADAASFCNSFSAHIAVLSGAMLLASVFCVVLVGLPLLGVSILVWLAVILVRLIQIVAPKVFERSN